MKKVFVRISAVSAAALAVTLFAGSMFAQAPTANAVPFLASNPTSPHTSWSGNQVTLKGTMSSPNIGTHSFTYDWNPGDGGTHCTGTVTNQYDIECQYTYSGAIGSVFTAVLTITDTTNSLVSPPSNCPPSITQGACYYTSLNAAPPNLPVEVNNAIDNGLWYLHTHMQRITSGNGAQIGNWYGVGGNTDTASAGGSGADSIHCAAFENSGFLQTNIPLNPYSDDVRLCLNGIFDQLYTNGISAVDIGFGSVSPDSNGNGTGVGHNGYPENYQTGMMLDAIAAAGTPGTVVTAGTALGNAGITGTGAGGTYTYKDAVFDMVDEYVYCQAPLANDGFGDITQAGGWHYSCQEGGGDNSVSQWAAIGIIPARRKVGTAAGVDPIPSLSLTANQSWLGNSFTQVGTNNGYFGYTSASPIWGPYADTPSGMVQLAMNGKGRGTTINGSNLWDSAETFLRDNFGNSGGPDSNPKAYYYGLLSFTKSMLLHDNSVPTAGNLPGLGNTPLTLLQSLDDPGTCASPVPLSTPGSGSGPCYPPIDWYSAQTSAYGGTDPTDGVARTLVSQQNADGSWWGHNYTSQQYYLETGMAITMLNKTVFQPVPVACFTTNPTHVASGGPVTLDGGCSVDQNPANQLVSWMWDISGTGGTNFTVQTGSPQCLTPSCSKMIANFTLPPGQSLPYNFPVRLRVTDNASPAALTADVLGNVIIATPPNPPNANAGGPYNFCPNTSVSGLPVYAPFLLDGSKSTNPDQGQTDNTPGAPPSTITAFDWDYSCSGAFTDAHGAQVDATTAFDSPVDFGKSFNVCLRVTNNDNLAFPTAHLDGGLSSVASGQVTIHNATDEVCTHCVLDLGANAKASTPGNPATIQLYFTDTNNSTQFTIDHYNVYRSTSSSFVPNTQIAGATALAGGGSAAIAVAATPGTKLFFLDKNVVGGTTYYYRVAPATANDTETCNSNVTLHVSLPRGR
jgi:hypothetical protein